MDTKKVVTVLLIITIVFSIGTIWKVASADTDDFVPASVNTITTIQGDSGTIGIGILEPPQTEGTG
jgi:hypothetical protein